MHRNKQRPARKESINNDTGNAKVFEERAQWRISDNRSLFALIKQVAIQICQKKKKTLFIHAYAFMK